MKHRNTVVGMRLFWSRHNTSNEFWDPGVVNVRESAQTSHYTKGRQETVEVRVASLQHYVEPVEIK
jgi:hypothetical protein